MHIPCLIITDIDSVDLKGNTCCVSQGEYSSNATINEWVKKVKSIKHDAKIPLSSITSLTVEEKTDEMIHLEFQTEEDKICGRSLEDAIINCNRTMFIGSEPATEESIKFRGNSKTTFALDLINLRLQFAHF